MGFLKIVRYSGPISSMTLDLNELQFLHLLKNINNKVYA